MDQKKSNEKNCICKKNYSGENQTDVSCEYTLPDYFPDIKRILHIFFDVRKTGMYISDDKVEYDGCVRCGVLYRGEDKGLYCAEFKTDFSDFINTKGASGDINDVSFILKNTNLRALTPRKVSLKSRVEAHADVWQEENTTPDVSGVDKEEYVQSISKNILCRDVFLCEETGVGVSEDVNIPENMPQAQKIIHTFIEPRTVDVKSDDGKITVRSEVCGVVIYEPSEDASRAVVMPVDLMLSHTVACENAMSGSLCVGNVDIYDITADISENTQGEKRVIELDFLYDIKIFGSNEHTAKVSVDMFAVLHTGRTKYKTVCCEKSCAEVKGNFSVNAPVPKEMSDNITGDVLTAFGDVESFTCNISDGKMLCCGSCEINVLFDNKGEYDSARALIPFKGEIEIPANDYNKISKAFCTCGDVKIRTDGENYFADTEIYIDSLLCREESYEIIESAEFSKISEKQQRGGYTLYYPNVGEDVWSVAKKYGVSLDGLKKANNISDTATYKKVMIIPEK